MRAIHIKEFGDVENLELIDVPSVGEPAEGEVRVTVKAAGVNRADILQRMGRYPAPKDFPQRIPGLEFSGIIDAVGTGVRGFEKGDRVMGIVPGGAQAEQLNTSATLLSEIPANLSFEEASAIPEAFVTAFDALVLQAELKKDETVLIHAVGSGVGLAATQIAVAFGAKAIGTSRNAEKVSRATDLGLSQGFVIADDSLFADRIKQSVGGIDVVLDLVGASYLKENIEALNSQGRLMLVGLTGGVRSEIDLSKILSKRLSITGTVLRSRSLEQREFLTSKFNEAILPLFENGTLKPNIDSVYKAEDVRDAHLRIAGNDNFGKVILTF
jgi:NADPH:quinone reductase